MLNEKSINADLVGNAIEKFAQVLPLDMAEIFTWYFEQKGVENPERFLNQEQLQTQKQMEGIQQKMQEQQMVQQIVQTQMAQQVGQILPQTEQPVISSDVSNRVAKKLKHYNKIQKTQKKGGE